MEWLYKADQDFLYAEGTLHIETLPFYFEMRYADERFVVATKQQAEEAREHARNIQERIRKKLGIVQAVVLEDIQRENALVDEELKKQSS